MTIDQHIRAAHTFTVYRNADDYDLGAGRDFPTYAKAEAYGRRIYDETGGVIITGDTAECSRIIVQLPRD